MVSFHVHVNYSIDNIIYMYTTQYTVRVVIFEVYYISLISRASLIHENYYYALLYFITHENFKIRTKTKNHENLLPRKL